jgi:high-affinity Fe2+/Pb2+ permease
MVANPNSTLLLENISLIWNLKVFARKHGLSYLYIFFSFLFFSQASEYPLFYLFRHLFIFLILSFLG